MLRPPPISRPDSEFETKLGVQFVEGREGIVITELNDLFEKVPPGREGLGPGGEAGAGPPRGMPGYRYIILADPGAQGATTAADVAPGTVHASS